MILTFVRLKITVPATSVTLFEINPMVVVCTERSVALGTLALSRLIARLETLETEDVETLGEYRVLLLNLARRTR